MSSKTGESSSSAASASAFSADRVFHRHAGLWGDQADHGRLVRGLSAHDVDRSHLRSRVHPQPAVAPADSRSMSLDHTKLDVYHRALDLLDYLDQIQELMPAGRAHLKDQLDRAGTSIVLNIAEGAGEFSRAEKQRFYRMARRSATESAAILDILERRKALDVDVLHPARELIVRVVSMLARLASK